MERFCPCLFSEPLASSSVSRDHIVETFSPELLFIYFNLPPSNILTVLMWIPRFLLFSSSSLLKLLRPSGNYSAKICRWSETCWGCTSHGGTDRLAQCFSEVCRKTEYLVIAMALEIFTPYNCKGFLCCWIIDAFSFTLPLNEKLPSLSFNYYDEYFSYELWKWHFFFAIKGGKKSKIWLCAF